MRATYKEALTAEIPFEVTFLPQRDMPRLVEMAEGPWDKRYCAALLLRTLVQRPLFADYCPGPDDSPRKVRGDAAAIRRWWDQNKSLLRFEKGRFVQILSKPL